MAAPGKLTQFPNGVASFGIPVVPATMLQVWGGGKVLWVGNRSGLPAGDGSSPTYPLSALFGTSGALAKTNTTPNGTIFVLPGHVESIAASTNMSTTMGTGSTGWNIVGLGTGAQRATFNWTAAASALLVNIAGTWFRNLVFNLNKTAATVVTAAITHSAADCGMDSVDFLPNTSATQLTTTAITAASGATNLQYINCTAKGETFATNPTDFFTTTAAIDRLTMIDCKFLIALNATTNGAVNLANAPTNVYMENCSFMNKKASSTIAAVASASTTGVLNGVIAAITNATGGATAIGTPGNLNMSFCRGGVIGKNAIDITPQSG